MLKMSFVEFAVTQGKETENPQTSASLKHGRGFFVNLTFDYQMESELLMMQGQVLSAANRLLFLVSSGMRLGIQPSQYFESQGKAA
jgi:hypothetical protein